MKSKLRSKNRTNYENPFNPKLQLISINRRGTIFENIPLGTRMISTIFRITSFHRLFAKIIHIYSQNIHEKLRYENGSRSFSIREKLSPMFAGNLHTTIDLFLFIWPNLGQIFSRFESRRGSK